MVRCLAPTNKAEHWFDNHGDPGRRFCPSCRRRIEANPAKYAVPPIMLHPLKAPKDTDHAEG